MNFLDFGIDLGGKTGEEIKTVCPQCSHTRKKKNYPCLNVNTDKGVWNCWHCGWSGGLRVGEYSRPILSRKREFFKPTYTPESVSTSATDFLVSRGITTDVIQRNRIGIVSVYMPQIEDEVRAIAFPYVSGGEVVNIKFRDRGKNFRQVGGAQKVLYKIDDIAETTIICEGEIDALSCEVAGYKAAISVPDGAPAINTINYETKFDYLNDQRLDEVSKFILAVDSDEPGRKLEEELARRLGRDRCLRVTWADGCKDANEVLLRYGVDALREIIESAQPYPLEGVFTVEDISEDLDSIFYDGLPSGEKTGWPSLDELYSPAPAQWTLVTGIPSMGKSEWLDALAVNLAEGSGWVFGICSPENQPITWHSAKLIEKRMKKRLRFADKVEFDSAKAWLNEHFHFILPEQPTIESVMEKAKVLVKRFGMKGLIIDPFNELDHTKRKDGITETEYVSAFLTYVRKFARENGVHVWLVAHPAKLIKTSDGKYPVPDGYSVSGSAHFFNKADCILAVHRDKSDPHAPSEIHVQKVRSRWLGNMGVSKMYWDPQCGRYSETRNIQVREMYDSGRYEGGSQVIDF